MTEPWIMSVHCWFISSWCPFSCSILLTSESAICSGAKFFLFFWPNSDFFFFCKTIWSISLYVSIIQGIVFLQKRVWKWRYFEIRVSRRVKSGNRLRRAVRVAALLQPCRCTVTHYCGTVGRMRGGYRINKGHMGKGRGRRKKWGSKDLKHWNYRWGDCVESLEEINSRLDSLWLEMCNDFRMFRLHFLVSVRHLLNLMISSRTEGEFPISLC